MTPENSNSYFSSQRAKDGHFGLAWNGSEASLLVPEGKIFQLEKSLLRLDLITECTMSRGELRRQDSLQLVFEDGTESPWVVMIPIDEAIRVPEIKEKPFTVVVCTEYKTVLKCPCHFQVVERLPVGRGKSVRISGLGGPCSLTNTS